ncbi:hypothetical protein BUALT_Bualt13G0081200 [Buddleja alternifolia]|uniref:PAR1 n=1 Tax=Buddleja alternifolia TaxID=168488 RepID=A0AAV6WU58_9LAMI|nr:hypothetical protein BUALT_Bualt13G0081200 [Buddleja alternifolia]
MGEKLHVSMSHPTVPDPSTIIFGYQILNILFGVLVCEELPIGMCTFSISSTGNRCLLETFELGDGNLKFQCKTSQVLALNMREYIESDECVSSCGVDRNSFGISSDSLLDSEVTLKLCSPQCYNNCPNIRDLYYNLALAEGN